MVGEGGKMNTMKNIFLTRLLCIFAVIALAGCGGSPSSSSIGDSTGSIAARLDWGQGKSSFVAKLFAVSAVSVPAAVVTVRIIVTGSDMTNIQKDFPAADGQGLIEGVPVGSDRTVTALGLDAGGAIIYKGSKGTVSVAAGQTTDIGTITMLPVGPAFSNATLNGPWLLTSNVQGRAYIIFDGKGGVSGVGAFHPATPPGTYQVQPDGSFTITLNEVPVVGPQTVLTGSLASSGSGSYTVTQGRIPGETGNIIRVSNPAACQGTWSGTLSEQGASVTRTVSFTVDGSGAVTSSTGLAGPVTGKMFCEAGFAAAFLRTGEPNAYNQLNISGTISGSALAGSFINDSNSGGTASLSLASTGGTLPAGFPSSVPTGNYTISIVACSSGFCSSGGSFTQINTDINQFAQTLVDALNTANNQVLTSDCAQAGCSCPAASISYTPWDGTSFTITDSFTVTCGGSSSSGSVQFIVTQGGAASGLDFTTLLGTWTGQWVNSTFGTSGSAGLVTTIVAGNTVHAGLTLGGNVFGSTAARPPISLDAPLSPAATSLSFAAVGTSIGDVHVTIGSDGSLEATVTNLPDPSIASVAVTGTVSSKLIQGFYTITFTSGSTAVGTLTLSK